MVDNIANPGFYDLAEGLEDITPHYREGTGARALVPLTVQAPTFDGVLPGDLVVQGYAVKMAQLTLAPKEYLLYPNFNYTDTTSDELRRCAEALDRLGAHLPPLTVLPTGCMVVLQGKSLPQYAVYDDPIQFTAMQCLRRSLATVIIEDTTPTQLLIRALRRVRHTQPMSPLDEFDVAARLDADGVDQDEIARLMSHDVELKGLTTQPTISKMIAASRLPQAVRLMIHSETVGRSHAYALAGRLRQDEPAAIAMATWVAQTKPRVNDLIDALNICHPTMGEPRGYLLQHSNGGYELVITQPDEEPSPPPPLRIATITAIRDDEIRRMTQNAHRAVRVRVEDGEVVVDPVSFKGYAAFIHQAQDHAVTLHDAEVMAFGFLAALRQACQAQNVLTRQGKLAPAVTKEQIIP